MNDPQFEEALRLEASGQYEHAIALFQDVVADNPGFRDAYIHLASVQGLLGRFAEAEMSARSALRVDGNSGWAHYYLACALRDQNKGPEAFLHMERALVLVKQEAGKGTLAGAAGVNPAMLPGPAMIVQTETQALRMLLRSQGKYYLNINSPFIISIPHGWRSVGFITRFRNRLVGIEAEFRPPGMNIPAMMINIVGRIARQDMQERINFAHQWLREGRRNLIAETILPTRHSDAAVIYYDGGSDGLQHGKASVIKADTEVLLEIKCESLRPYQETYEAWLRSFM